MKPTLLALLLLATLNILAQNAPAGAVAQDAPVLLLKGIIRDAATGEPIPYATLSLAANGITTLTNEEGRFRFIIPPENQNDTIFISHVGYRSIALQATADTTTRTITLHQSPVNLPDIIIHPINGWDLIQQAIEKIPDNYPTRPFVLTAFYRNDGRNKGHLIDLSEAVFTIYSPDNQRKNMQFRLIRARSDRDLTAFDGHEYSVGFQPDAIMNRDMISRIHQTQILGDQGHNDHQFTYHGLIDYEGTPAFEIRFDQRDDVARPLYKGRIIIDTTTLAFLCFDYGLSPKGLRFRGAPAGGPLHNELISNHLLIQYRRYGNKYYLHQVTIQPRIHSWIDGKPPVDYDTLNVLLNCLVTRIDTGFVAFSRVGNKLNDERKIEQQIKENVVTKKDSYWENYNLIAADYNVDSALAVIRANNSKPKKHS